MRIRTRVSDNARVYLYTSSFPFRSLHSAHSARRYSYPDRIVLRSPGRLENTLLHWSTAVGTTGPPLGNIPGRNKCGKSGVSYRPSTTNLATFLLSFPKLDRRRIERSILRSIDSRFLPPPNRPLLNSTETFLLARNEFRDFPSISHSSRGTSTPPREISRSIESGSFSRILVKPAIDLRLDCLDRSCTARVIRGVRLTGERPVYKRRLSPIDSAAPLTSTCSNL